MHNGDTPQATMVFVRGLPGSGKTYLAEKIQIALADKDVVMLDPDKIDYDSAVYKAHVEAQIAEGVEPALHAYRFSRAQAYDGIAAGKVVMWNQPFTNLEIFDKMNARLRDHAAEHNVALKVLVVEVNVDPEVAYERVIRRKSQGGHGPSREVFDRFVRDYHSFAEHGYDVIVVDGADIASATHQVLQKLSA